MISVVIPTMNEAEALPEVIRRVREAVPGCEIIIVDTRSTDGTPEKALELGCRVVDEPRRGYGRAYKTGFEKARGEIVVTLDADLTYPPEEIPRLVERLRREGLDFLNTYRLHRRRSFTLINYFGNLMLTALMNLLFRTPFRDSQSGMWVLRREVLGRLRLTSDGMSFSEEIKIETWRAGLRVGEEPIAYSRRVGERKLNVLRDGVENALFLIKKFLS